MIRCIFTVKAYDRSCCWEYDQPAIEKLLNVSFRNVVVVGHFEMVWYR